MRKHIQVLRLTNNMPYLKISQLTGVPRESVRRICSYKTSRTARSTRTGRPAKITHRDLRRLIRTICKSADGRRASIKKHCKDLGISALAEMVRRALRKKGFRRCVACPKPFINMINRKKRLQFAKEHRHWTVDDWKRVIWTDESSFETGK